MNKKYWGVLIFLIAILIGQSGCTQLARLGGNKFTATIPDYSLKPVAFEKAAYEDADISFLTTQHETTLTKLRNLELEVSRPAFSQDSGFYAMLSSDDSPGFELDNGYKVDSVWLTIQDYFSTWDTQNVDPYKLKMHEFKDTVYLNLFNENAGQYWYVPVKKSRITSNFGNRRYRWHHGTDVKLQRGDTVRAAFDGVVRVASYDRRGYGHYVVLRHYNGFESLYGHFLKKNVKVGQEVKAGDVVGFGGSTGRSTGYHLHFELRYKGAAINPTNIFDFENEELLSETYKVSPVDFQYLAELNKRIYHRIRSGDTLGGIGQRYGVSISKLCRLNSISRSTILRVGRRLVVR